MAPPQRPKPVSDSVQPTSSLPQTERREKEFKTPTHPYPPNTIYPLIKTISLNN